MDIFDIVLERAIASNFDRTSDRAESNSPCTLNYLSVQKQLVHFEYNVLTYTFFRIHRILAMKTAISSWAILVLSLNCSFTNFPRP